MSLSTNKTHIQRNESLSDKIVSLKDSVNLKSTQNINVKAKKDNVLLRPKQTMILYFTHSFTI